MEGRWTNEKMKGNDRIKRDGRTGVQDTHIRLRVCQDAWALEKWLKQGRDTELRSQSSQPEQPIGLPPLASESSFSQGMECRGGADSPIPQGGGSQAPSVSPQRGFVLGAKSPGCPEAVPWQLSKAVALSQVLPGLYNTGHNLPKDSLSFCAGETEAQEGNVT